MRLTTERTITKEQVQAIAKEMTAGTKSKGASIRECFAGGMDVKEISAELDIRYNHVYNVVKNEVLVHGLEVEKSGRDSSNSKKALILGMLAEGKTVNEVAVETKSLYNYVWQIAKAGGYTKAQMDAKAEEARLQAEAEAAKQTKGHKKVVNA